TIGFIGAGSFAQSNLLPNIPKKEKIILKGVITASGTGSRTVADRFGFEFSTSNDKDIFEDKEINTVFIATRHDSHAQYVIKALKAAKHVFVEKPLCLREEELNEIISTYNKLINSVKKPVLMVGYNRRFSALSKILKKKTGHGKMAMIYRINAGPIPPDSWIQDPEIGGGRIIGEVCHFIDLIQYLTNSFPIRVYAETISSDAHKSSDNVAITLKMQNGAIGSISYLAGGDKRYQRERIEVFGGGAVGVIENFRKAFFIRNGKQHIKRNLLCIDRGHRSELEAVISAILEKKSSPVDIEEYVATTLATFAIEQSLINGSPQIVDMESLQ
ncbi:MAG: Gfo/Idh/MocA family oxidoreductase, partial [Candidatus Omnitrophica bacterium]|nr:Gfo/Idh/MocA family oxidoreductase [Candidatus Omnitrophota bacterium]